MKAHHRIQATGDFGKDEVVQAINVALNKCEKVNKDNFIPTFRKIADWELKKIGGKIFVVRVSRILRNYEIELFSVFSEVHLGENASRFLRGSSCNQGSLSF